MGIDAGGISGGEGSIQQQAGVDPDVPVSVPKDRNGLGVDSRRRAPPPDPGDAGDAIPNPENPRIPTAREFQQMSAGAENQWLNATWMNALNSELMDVVVIGSHHKAMEKQNSVLGQELIREVTHDLKEMTMQKYQTLANQSYSKAIVNFTGAALTGVTLAARMESTRRVKSRARMREREGARAPAKEPSSDVDVAAANPGAVGKSSSRAAAAKASAADRVADKKAANRAITQAENEELSNKMQFWNGVSMMTSQVTQGVTNVIDGVANTELRDIEGSLIELQYFQEAFRRYVDASEKSHAEVDPAIEKALQSLEQATRTVSSFLGGQAA